MNPSYRRLKYVTLPDALLAAQPHKPFFRNLLITLNNHHCHAAARRTVELHRRNVDRFVRQHRRHIRHMSRLIVVVDNQGWITAGKIGFNPIDLRNIDPGTAQ